MNFRIKNMHLLPISIGAMIIMFSKSTVTFDVNFRQVISGLLLISFGLLPCLKKE